MTSWVVAVLLSAAGGVSVDAPGCPPALQEAVQAELTAAGFELVSGQAPIAVVSLGCDEERGVKVRVEDAVTLKAVERRVELSPGPRGVMLVGVQVVELLHASLAEARWAREVTVVPAQVEQFLERREPVPWRVELGAGALVSPGGFGAEPEVGVSVWRSQPLVGWRLELGAQLDATVRATRLRSVGGTADVGVVLARLAVGASFEALGLSWTPRLGVGALLVWASGNAEGAYQAHTGVVPTALGLLGFSASRQLAAWVRVGLFIEGGGSPWPVVVLLPDGSTSVGAGVFTASAYVAFQ